MFILHKVLTLNNNYSDRIIVKLHADHGFVNNFYFKRKKPNHSFMFLIWHISSSLLSTIVKSLVHPMIPMQKQRSLVGSLLLRVLFFLEHLSNWDFEVSVDHTCLYILAHFHDHVIRSLP